MSKRTHSNFFSRWRYLIIYRKPVYIPGYVPIWHYLWFKIVAVVVVILSLMILYAIISGIARLIYNSNEYTTTYTEPQDITAVVDSKYNGECLNDKSVIANLIACIGLTNEGKKVVELTKPHFATEEIVAKECEIALTSADVAIFGCWNFLNGNENITILYANDTRYASFNEKPEITLTHELLHSVYYHLQLGDQQRIWRELSSMYPEMVVETEKLGYSYFEIDDELFARVGSEKSNAGEFTKSIFAKYLTKWGDNDDVSTPDNVKTMQKSEEEKPANASSNKTNPNYESLQTCNVTRISDGDTFYVDCLNERIRLIGVDTPESTNKVQCYGNEASNYTANNLLGRKVYLESDSASGEVDIYGRPLRYVYLEDGTNWNMKLIEDGYGMLYIFSNQNFAYKDAFSDAEDAARSAGVGLWSNCSLQVNRYNNYEVIN